MRYTSAKTADTRFTLKRKNRNMGKTKVRILNTSKYENPFYSTEGSSGMDLRANTDAPVVLKPLERHLFPTGIKIALERGYEAQIRPRSGLACKHGITVTNAPGTVDSDYRGEIGVSLVNISNEEYTINPGDRIAQMVIAKYETVEFEDVVVLDETERGEGGFGHTGK